MLKSTLLQSFCAQIFRTPRRLRSGFRVRSIPQIERTEHLEPRVLLSANPIVTSMDRIESIDTNATSVGYTVTFSEDVLGVDATDFTVLTSDSVTAKATVSVATYLYSTSQVTALIISGNDGSDTIQINNLLAGVSLTADGGNGNATMKVAASVMNAVTLTEGNGE